jgi:FKBP-type peptidyl-prolyl cis-trans isomerase (trigger factor)
MELSKEERNKLKTEIKKELSREINEMVEAEIKKQMKGKATEKHIKEISAKVLEDLFRALWNRSSMWKSSVVK